MEIDNNTCNSSDAETQEHGTGGHALSRTDFGRDLDNLVSHSHFTSCWNLAFFSFTSSFLVINPRINLVYNANNFFLIQNSPIKI